LDGSQPPAQLSFRLGGGTCVGDFANSTELNPSVIETPGGTLKFAIQGGITIAEQ
jgi:hypothetical protein